RAGGVQRPRVSVRAHDRRLAGAVHCARGCPDAGDILAHMSAVPDRFRGHGEDCLSEPVIVSKENGIAVIQIDNPPVNALSGRVAEALSSAVDRAEHDPDVRALVVMGAGRTFIAGADIKALERTAWEGVSPPDAHGL